MVADESAAGLTACTAGADGAPTLAADESISLTQSGVMLHIDDAPASAAGVLYVTTRCGCCAPPASQWHARRLTSARRRLVWFSSAGTEGYEVPFRSIVLHAVSRDASTSPQPCILAQVEGPAPGASSGEDEDDDEPACTQLRLVPADKAARACSQPPLGLARLGLLRATDTGSPPALQWTASSAPCAIAPR